jgi:hypothetical protein
VELELHEELPEPRRIGLADAHLVQGEGDRKVGANRDELLGQARHFGLLLKRFARPLLRQGRCRGEDRLEVAVFGHQLARGLVAHAFHARHVVRAVADQREVVGDVRRGYPEPLRAVLDRDPLLFHARRAATTRVEQPHSRLHELLKILVAGDDHHVDAGRDPLPSQRSDHIVRFIALQGEDGNAVRLQQLADPLHPRIEVGLELLGQLLAGRLVAGIALMAKAQPGVVHPPEVLGFVRREQALKEVDDPPRGGGVLAPRRRERTGDEREERAVDQRVSVDQKEPRRVGTRGGRRSGERGIGHGRERQDDWRCAKDRACTRLAIPIGNPRRGRQA